MLFNKPVGDVAHATVIRTRAKLCTVTLTKPDTDTLSDNNGR